MSKRLDRDSVVFNKKDVKIPSWSSDYELFKSPTDATDAKTVIKEYRDLFDKWYAQNRGANLELFRKKHGIIIDQQGQELLTASFKNKRRRAIQEGQQAPKGRRSVKGKGVDELRLPTQLPDWFPEAQAAGFKKLEGHHVLGLNVLDIFFEGVSPDEAFELRQAMINKGVVAGKDARNWAWLTETQHNLAHSLLALNYQLEGINPKTGKGMKGKPAFSKNFKKWIRSLPAVSDVKAYPGQSAFSGPGRFAKKNLTKKDILLDWVELTEDAFKGAVIEAVKAKPISTDFPASKQVDYLTGQWSQATPGAQTLAFQSPAETAFREGFAKLDESGKALVNTLRNQRDIAQAKQIAVANSRMAMVNPAMFGASAVLGAWALSEREKEVAANPNDNWLKFQLQLDRTALGADIVGGTTSAAALTGWGALAPVASEITSNVAAGASMALDFGRWVKDPEAREETMEYWKDVYNRGARGLVKVGQQFF